MKPFTPTVLGEAPALVTSLGIFEWENRSVLMLPNRRQNNRLYGQRARMLHLELARLPPRQPRAPELFLPPQEGVLSQSAKSGHGTAEHQWFRKPVTAPGYQALSDCGTAEREKEARRGKRRKKKEKREKEKREQRGKKRQREKKSQEMQRKAMARDGIAAWSGVQSELEKGSGGSPSPEGWLGMLPMSHCCSLISGYVHCTEIIFLPRLLA